MRTITTSTPTPLPHFSVIVAATHSGGIGVNGDMPWGQSLKQDLARFKQITTSTTPSKRHAVIMGRHTWNSIPSKFRPLPNRLNVVLTTQEITAQEIESSVANANQSSILTSSSLTCALTTLSSHSDVDDIFVIGGGHLYAEALSMPQCETIHQTLVLKEFPCDTYFPVVDRKLYHITHVSDIIMDNNIPYQFLTYQRHPEKSTSPSSTTLSEQQQNTLLDDSKQVNHEELAYLDLVRNVIEHGVHKGDRTGTGTISKFGTSLRFSLRDGVFPLLTTKTVFWRGVVEELLWLVRGCTDSKILTAKKVHIWDGNGSRSFLDNLGFTQREEGDLGPVYGFQWRHFGAEYVDCHTDYTGQGVDQLQQIIDTIKKNPNDRRILMSAWNPSDLNKMALPPCHVMCQFYVANGELSCQMYQRSCDLGLGVPFNIASYSLLTCMIAHITGLKPGEFVHCMGDTHVYSNHVEPLLEQLRRTPGSFPKLSITRDASIMKSIDDFQFEDFQLEGYTPQGTIKMQMAV